MRVPHPRRRGPLCCSARTAYLLFCVSLKRLPPGQKKRTAKGGCSRSIRAASVRRRRLAFLVACVTGHVLLHSIFDPLAAYQEDGAFTDIHAMVRDALQIVDYQGCSHPPLRRAAPVVRGVGNEVHGLGVEEVYLIVSRLEAASPVHVPVLKDIEALVEYVPGGPGHLQEDRLEVLISLMSFGLYERPTNVLAEGPRPHEVVRHRLHGVEMPEVLSAWVPTCLEEHTIPFRFRPSGLVARVHPELHTCHTRVARLHGLYHNLYRVFDLFAEINDFSDKII